MPVQLFKSPHTASSTSSHDFAVLSSFHIPKIAPKILSSCKIQQHLCISIYISPQCNTASTRGLSVAKIIFCGTNEICATHILVCHWIILFYILQRVTHMMHVHVKVTIVCQKVSKRRYFMVDQWLQTSFSLKSISRLLFHTSL